MKHLILCGILLGVLTAGCADNELLQCQQDKGLLADELQKVKVESAEDRAASIEFIEQLKVAEDKLAKARAANTQMREKLVKHTNAALLSQQEVKKHEAKITELQAKLKAAEERFKKTADILRGQVEENSQLKQQMAEQKSD